jgi:hypothetical protein
MKDAAKPADPIEQNAGDLKAYLAAPVGAGTLDFARPLAVATAADFLVVEQDFSDGDMFQDVALSRRRLREMGY